MKYLINTEIEICAPVDTVWNTLIQFSDYEKWNTFIPMALGEPIKGEFLNIIINVPDDKKAKYKVKILNVEHQKNLQWLGAFLIPGLIDGHHTFELKVLDHKKTLLVHKESFSGLLVPFVWKYYLNTKLRSGFYLFNQELKQHIENNKS